MKEPHYDPGRLPEHIGIIMDGNGRWARNHGKPRSFGHKEGLTAVKRVVKAASDIGIKFLTLYIFSTENWKRTAGEVSFLMQLILVHLRTEFNFYRNNNIKVIHSGDKQGLKPEIRKEIDSVIYDTKGFDGLTINLAINYGGRDEIIRSINRWLKKQSHDSGISSIDEEIISANLDCRDIPDPDIIIRTSGEQRLSNFLLWESAYSELYFSEKLWPDWDRIDLIRSISEFQKRKRKFGGIK